MVDSIVSYVSCALSVVCRNADAHVCTGDGLIDGIACTLAGGSDLSYRVSSPVTLGRYTNIDG